MLQKLHDIQIDASMHEAVEYFHMQTKAPQVISFIHGDAYCNWCPAKKSHTNHVLYNNVVNVSVTTEFSFAWYFKLQVYIWVSANKSVSNARSIVVEINGFVCVGKVIIFTKIKCFDMPSIIYLYTSIDAFISAAPGVIFPFQLKTSNKNHCICFIVIF